MCSYLRLAENIKGIRLRPIILHDPKYQTGSGFRAKYSVLYTLGLWYPSILGYAAIFGINSIKDKQGDPYHGVLRRTCQYP